MLVVHGFSDIRVLSYSDIELWGIRNRNIAPHSENHTQERYCVLRIVDVSGHVIRITQYARLTFPAHSDPFPGGYTKLSVPQGEAIYQMLENALLFHSLRSRSTVRSGNRVPAGQMRWPLFSSTGAWMGNSLFFKAFLYPVTGTR